MRVLVVGSGGREHALAWKLAQEADVIVAPGNAGIAQELECIPIPATDPGGLIALSKERGVDLVVVGPEDPLVDGLADALRLAGIAVFGPGRNGAQLEASKAFSKSLMAEAGVPTARFQSFTDAAAAKAFVAEMAMEGRTVVVKASGNALGKGVIVCGSQAEAEDAIEAMLVDRAFGDAGAEIVVEERLVGFEFSLLTICSEAGFWSLPIAQDYKRALDGDRGPNTGGMGTYSPVPRVSEDLVKRTERQVVAPILEALKARGIPYRGVLFSGLLVQDGQPYCLEYNVRFGDPETQSVVRRLGIGFADALLAAANGQPIPPVEVKDEAVVSVVLASGGYPGDYRKGLPIGFGAFNPEVKVFFAGVGQQEGQLVTSGGRVMAVTATGPSIADARDRAYAGVLEVCFDEMHYRRDVAAL